MNELNKHFEPQNLSDKVALSFTKFLRFLADTFFKKRYGHRAVVLETVAAVPGMVAGMLIHLKSLRKMEDDRGWIKTLLDEAENERMHLMTFIHIAKPTWLERVIILTAQFIFIVTYALIYLISQELHIELLDILKKKLLEVTLNIYTNWKLVKLKINQLQKLQLIIGIYHLILS